MAYTLARLANELFCVLFEYVNIGVVKCLKEIAYDISLFLVILVRSILIRSAEAVWLYVALSVLPAKIL